MLMFYLTKLKWCNEYLRFSCRLLYMFATLKFIQILARQHVYKCWLSLWIMTTSILFCMFWTFFCFLFEITCNIHLSSNFFFFRFVSMFCDYLQFWLLVLRLFAFMKEVLLEWREIKRKKHLSLLCNIVYSLVFMIMFCKKLFCDNWFFSFLKSALNIWWLNFVIY